jgi:hypothetical protein
VEAVTRRQRVFVHNPRACIHSANHCDVVMSGGLCTTKRTKLECNSVHVNLSPRTSQGHEEMTVNIL